ILVDEATTGAEDITLGFCRFEPGAYHERHAHGECEEVAYMISGRMVGGVSTGPDDPGKEIIWEPGDILFVPRGGTHWFYNPFDEPQTHVFMYTRPSLKTAGYSLESEGYQEIGGKVEEKQKEKA
ncbi:MAG: cupin domain-containing protein, partial [Butyricicoccus sp.]